jgi:hypothetical protein
LEGLVLGDSTGVLFCQIGADTLAAGVEVIALEAFTFVVFGLHDCVSSAERFADDCMAIAPWLSGAVEQWSAVLQPFRHKGRSNHLNPSEPGSIFDSLAAPVAPFVVVTSVGWNTDDGFDPARPADFGAGTNAVRMAMTAVEGLHSQQTFFFPGLLVHDPITVTFWRDDASARAFAYEHGSHRRQLDRYHATKNADRTSFTRFAVLASKGTWYGRDPLAFT